MFYKMFKTNVSYIQQVYILQVYQFILRLPLVAVLYIYIIVGQKNSLIDFNLSSKQIKNITC